MGQRGADQGRPEAFGTGLDHGARGPAISKLAEGGSLRLDLFDERDMAEITSADYPGERLVVCRDPALARERAGKRDELLTVTDDFGPCQMVGNGLEVVLDGFYVVRTSLPSAALDSAGVVTAYKGLSLVEQAFRGLRTVDLKARPIFHRRDRRVRAHVFVCMLAYYVEWHMRQACAPMLFDDRQRTSPVAKARRLAAADGKAESGGAADGPPVHSFRALLGDLATLTRNTLATKGGNPVTFTAYAAPTAVQKKAFELLGVKQTR